MPTVFALKLTYPEPVTPFNVDALRRAVIAGPEQHPGATHIMDEHGLLTSLPANAAAREALANALLTPTDRGSGLKHASKRVYRHIRNGDLVLMNRQPTLHKASIMAHKVRVLPGERTLRMHYANCKTYNADFDGDEMNMHFAQNELARAEAENIVLGDHQCVPVAVDARRRGLPPRARALF